MSTTMITCGYMAVLETPIPEADWEAAVASLEVRDNKLGLNYDGTIIYSRETSVESCDFAGLHLPNEQGKHDFMIATAKANYSVVFKTVNPFFCQWYNGSDSPMSTITKTEFLKE